MLAQTHDPVPAQLGDLETSVLCPPSHEGWKRELYMQFLCVVLAVANVMVFSNLLYDIWQYKTRGILPKIVHWLPYL